jgi:hypothetical protein
MLGKLKNAALAVVLATGSMVAATSAEARDHWRDRRGDDAAIAIGAGILGLAVGAAIASDRDDRYYRGRPYYRGYPRGAYYDDYYYTYPRRHYRAYRYDRPRQHYRDHRRWRDDRRGYRRGWGY